MKNKTDKTNIIQNRVDAKASSACIVRQKEIDEAIELLDKLIEVYYQVYPPGTITKDGRFIMGSDGLWYGRCHLSA